MMFGTTLVALGLALLALTLPARAQQPAPNGDPVVAIVDGAEVHRSEVEAMARGLPEQFRQVPLPQIYGMLLDRTIDFRLLAQAAEQADLAQNPDVQVQIEQARAGVLRDAFVRQKIEEFSRLCVDDLFYDYCHGDRAVLRERLKLVRPAANFYYQQKYGS